MHGYFLASVALLIIGGFFFLFDLPYAIKYFGEPPFRYCCAMAGTGSPSSDWLLGYDDTFASFMPYSLILLAVGGLLFLAYVVERKEIANTP